MSITKINTPELLDFPNDSTSSANTSGTVIPKGTTAERPGIATLDFLVVGAGGGVYGYDSPGGGGGGGVRTSYGSQSGGASAPESKFSFDTTGTTSYTLTVGEGVQQLNGEDSVFGSITSLGGGYGASGGNANAGSSGGGGTGGGAFSAGSGTTGQGFAGGTGYVGTPAYPGGGGGGSGAIGQSAPSGSVLGNGGVGTIVNILPHGTASTINIGEVSGTDVYYSGGGGGNSAISASGGTGGLGGGADAPNNNNTVVDGTINTGGGGAGGIYPVTGVYAKGGSGVVILRYSSDFTLGKTGTLVEASGSPFTEGSEKISVFISGDGTVNFTGGGVVVSTGEFRFNTTTGYVEYYDGSTWLQIADEYISGQPTQCVCNYPTTATNLWEFNDDLTDTCGGTSGTGYNISYATGKYGKAVVFNVSSSSYVDTNYIFGSGSSTISFSLWMYLDSSGAYSSDMEMIANWDSGYNNMNIQAYIAGAYGNDLRVGIDNGGNISSGWSPTLDTWHHLVFTVDGSTVKIYADAVLQTTSTSGTWGANAGYRSLVIGAAGPGGLCCYFPGMIDQFRIFPSILTQAQITELYNELPCN